MTRLNDMNDDALPEYIRRERFSSHLGRFLTLLSLVMLATVSALVFLIWLVSLIEHPVGAG